MFLRFTRNRDDAASDKLADVALVFEEGALAGLTLVGFAIWRQGDDSLKVTFPSRTVTVRGEARRYALLRPLSTSGTGDVLRGRIVDAYAEYAKQVGKAADLWQQIDRVIESTGDAAPRPEPRVAPDRDHP